MHSLVIITLAYIVGGLTFLPIVGVAVYFVHLCFTWWNDDRHQFMNDCQATEPVTRHDHQFYKVGWLRVSRDEQRLPPPDASIGEMVKSYISGRNKEDDGASQVYFAALKYSTLFLYDSEKQLDCKEVIQVNHHTVSFHPHGLEDHEVYTRPPLIKLEHTETRETYYINCNRCIDKEDWYIALIRASKLPHTKDTSVRPFDEPTHFEQSAIHSLITTIHSDEHHFQTQWFNALLGRVFFGVYKTDTIKNYIYNKLVTKISKLNARRPPFLGEIAVRSVDPGQGLPQITQPRLVSLSPTGEITVEGHMQYSGGIRFEIETELKWKYADVLPPLTIDLVLAITLKQLDGRFLMKIKEPPTNRLWYGFYTLPKIQWLVEPVVWEKRVGYSVVVKAIETKIEELITENLVLPNLDDLTFFPTAGAGGIFNVAAEPATPQLHSSPQSMTPEKRPNLVATPSLPELRTTDKPKPKRWFSTKDELNLHLGAKNATPATAATAATAAKAVTAASESQKPVSPMTAPVPSTILSSSVDSLSSSLDSSCNSSAVSFPHPTPSPDPLPEGPRIRKSASLARLKTKSLASTAVSQVSVLKANDMKTQAKDLL